MRVDYFFVPDGAGAGTLARRAAPARTNESAGLAAADVAEAYYEILIPGLAGWEVSYFDGAGWASTWDGAARGGPPRLVQVRLHFAADVGSAQRQVVLPIVIEAPLLGGQEGAL
jgi:hypothetical protein